jgi:hypothetical protein
MDDNEHQIIKDIRLLNGWDESVPQPNILKSEAAKLAMMNPVARSHHIRDVENRVLAYDKNSNLRQQTQGFRLTQTLKTAHERLKATGR